ncbi:MAG: DUF4837 family protein [Candidatus Marinimicrobia bacterium]|nr:DUF4837 family protein [Candidatus Neomarinimicrobiota bacterium]MDD5581691.1 DUF4837 family protein [Candidatus Neomarinimicrobiota bacterium]
MKRLILIGLTIISIVGCEPYKKLAVGDDCPVYTFVDDSLWAKIEEDIRKPVEKVIRTPQPEKIFYFVPVPLSDLKDYQFSKNLIFITTLDRTDNTSQYIQNMLPDSALRMIERGERYLFPIKEKLARRQIFIILAAPNDESLLTYIQNEGNTIYEALNEAFIERQFEQMYYKVEGVEITKYLFETYGFSFRVPHTYEILEENPEERVIQLGRPSPYRWVTIYWQKGGFTSLLDEKWAIKMRYWLSTNYLDGTYVEDRFLTYRIVYWGSRPVYNIRGLWGHPEKAMGGPFSSFYFYDGVTDRIYFIDLCVWAPDQNKNVYLRQMELMVSTFFTSESVLEEYLKK